MNNLAQNPIGYKTVQNTIERLIALGCPPLPVAPAQDAEAYPARDKQGEIKRDKQGQAIPAFTGKNPSYLDRDGIPHLISHQKYQGQQPTKAELTLWFANPANGIGTLGGHGGIVWIDFDAKHFDSPDDCQSAVFELIRQHSLEATWVERTGGGGFRFAVVPGQAPEFTNFALTPGGEHVGEALSGGRFTVLAPTVHPSGNPYELLSERPPIAVESLEAIGIYPTKTKKATQSKERPQRQIPIAGGLKLEDLGNPSSRDILAGADPKGDRSESLSTAIQEWCGWENWCSTNRIPYSSTAEDLAHDAGEALGIDADRVDRILKTVDSASCRPAAQIKGGDESCWKRIGRLDKATFKELCPAGIKQEIGGDTQPERGFDAVMAIVGAMTKDTPVGEVLTALPDVAALTPIERDEVIDRIAAQTGRRKGSLKQQIEQYQVKPQTEDRPAKCWQEIIVKDYTIGVNEWVGGRSGYKEFKALIDCDFTITKEIRTTRDGGRYEIRIQYREGGNLKVSQGVIRARDFADTESFGDALERVVGTRIPCSITKQTLQALLRDKKEAYYQSGGKSYKLAEVVGRQTDGTFVFFNCQFKDGREIPESNWEWIYNQELEDDEQTPRIEIEPKNDRALPRLAEVSKKFFHPAVYPFAICEHGSALAIVNRTGRTEHPQKSSEGDPGVGKSMAQRAAASPWGMHKKAHVMGETSASALNEVISLVSCLPIVVDDPIPLTGGKRAEQIKQEIDAVVGRIYNGKGRKVRGHVQPPRTDVLINSNNGIGGNGDALDQRVNRSCYPTYPCNTEYARELEEAMDQASGGVEALLQIPRDEAAIEAYAKEFAALMPKAVSRQARALAEECYYTEQFCQLAEISEDFDVHAFFVEVRCPQADETETAKDTLSDFLQKLAIYISRGEAGEYNVVKQVDKRGDAYLAVYLPSLFKGMKHEFDLKYGQNVVTAAIKDRGGFVTSTRFVRDQAAWKIYLSGLGGSDDADDDGKSYLDTPPPKDTTRDAWRIPESIVNKAMGEQADAIAKHFTYLNPQGDDTDPTDGSPSRSTPKPIIKNNLHKFPASKQPTIAAESTEQLVASLETEVEDIKDQPFDHRATLKIPTKQLTEDDYLVAESLKGFAEAATQSPQQAREIWSELTYYRPSEVRALLKTISPEAKAAIVEVKEMTEITPVGLSDEGDRMEAFSLLDAAKRATQSPEQARTVWQTLSVRKRSVIYAVMNSISSEARKAIEKAKAESDRLGDWGVA